MEVGKKFPDFSLPNQDGKTKTLSDYKGQWLVVYFYPKDDTPSCTIQANSFTATKEQFADAGISVVGVSADGIDSHKNFCNKFQIAIDLLADPNLELIKAANIGESDWQGTKYWDRTTFVIDPQGNLAKKYEKVSAPGHEQVLLEDIAKLKTQTAVH